MNNDLARFLEDFERREKKMPANDPGKLKRFVGAIGNLFVRKGLSPPFHISEYAAGWMRDGICRVHCLEQIGKLLDMPEHQYRRGAGDSLIEEMNQIIRTSWGRLRRSQTQSAIRTIGRWSRRRRRANGLPGLSKRSTVPNAKRKSREAGPMNLTGGSERSETCMGSMGSVRRFLSTRISRSLGESELA
jgi:hypothetical protein